MRRFFCHGSMKRKGLVVNSAYTILLATFDMERERHEKEV